MDNRQWIVVQMVEFDFVDDIVLFLKEPSNAPFLLPVFFYNILEFCRFQSITLINILYKKSVKSKISPYFKIIHYTGIFQ